MTAPNRQAAHQKHHDYYINLRRQNKLTDLDYRQYLLAVQREDEGLVQPLSKDTSKDALMLLKRLTEVMATTINLLRPMPTYELISIGELITTFVDPNDPKRVPHNVVCFPVKPEASLDDIAMIGPFGLDRHILIFGKRLYGVDTWGPVRADQLDHPANRSIKELWMRYADLDGYVLQLAGVRGGTELWKDPAQFQLIRILSD